MLEDGSHGRLELRSSYEAMLSGVGGPPLIRSLPVASNKWKSRLVVFTYPRLLELEFSCLILRNVSPKNDTEEG